MTGLWLAERGRRGCQRYIGVVCCGGDCSADCGVAIVHRPMLWCGGVTPLVSGVTVAVSGSCVCYVVVSGSSVGVW